MPETSVKLTKRAVDSAMPADARYRIWDSELKGFGLRVTPEGTKTYFVRYRPGGGGRGVAPKEFTIGKHGTLTPDMARAAAEKLLANVALGQDPQANLKTARAEMTMDQFCDLYIEKGMGMKKESTRKSDIYRINAHIRPLLGRKKLSLIDGMDIETFNQDVATGQHVKRKPSKVEAKRAGEKGVQTRKLHDSNARGGKGTATRTMILLSAMFSWAIYPAKLIKENPCKGVKKFKPRASTRFLNMDELRRVGEAMEDPTLNPKGIAIIRTLMLTGARKNEIQRLLNTEANLVMGFLALEDSKTGQKIIQIGVAAVTVLAEFVGKSNSRYVFPSDNPEIDGPFVGVPKIWNRIRKAAGVPDVRLHDLRHTFASVGIIGGDTLAMIGAILGHKDPKTTARYAHLAQSPISDAASNIDETIARSLGIKTNPDTKKAPDPKAEG